MAINTDLKNYLDRSHVPYETLSHPQSFSCFEIARNVGVRAEEVAKALVVKAKGKRAIVVLPGSSRLDARKLKTLMGHSDARLLLEEEMEKEFPSYEVGAIPPIGALFGFPVYVDERLQAEKIVFTGGTHVDSVRMNYSDFLSLVHPQVVDLVEEPE